MSGYDPSYDDPYRHAPRPVATVWPLLALLAGGALLLGGLVYWFWPQRQPSGPPAEPRTVVPAGNLSEAEKATIQIFKNASPSVVHVTNLAVQRNRLSLNLDKIERGTGTGFVWDD